MAFPSLTSDAAFGVDAAFSYKFNPQLGICIEDGLAVCSGLITSHVISVPLQGTPRFPQFCPLTAEEFQIVSGVEHFRCPEILFQPNMVGINQACLAEIAGVYLQRLSAVDDPVKGPISNSILVTGGGSLFPGMVPRLEAGIRQIHPYLSNPLKVVRASDPILDAWRGAATYAASLQFATQTFSIQDHHEKGESWLKQYHIKYTL